jgi:hypothetical protein
VIVAHARNVQLIGKSRKKDDRLDAQTLARFGQDRSRVAISGETSQRKGAGRFDRDPGASGTGTSPDGAGEPSPRIGQEL